MQTPSFSLLRYRCTGESHDVYKTLSDQSPQWSRAQLWSSGPDCTTGFSSSLWAPDFSRLASYLFWQKHCYSWANHSLEKVSTINSLQITCAKIITIVGKNGRRPFPSNWKPRSVNSFIVWTCVQNKRRHVEKLQVSWYSKRTLFGLWERELIFLTHLRISVVLCASLPSPSPRLSDLEGQFSRELPLPGHSLETESSISSQLAWKTEI